MLPVANTLHLTPLYNHWADALSSHQLIVGSIHPVTPLSFSFSVLPHHLILIRPLADGDSMRIPYAQVPHTSNQESPTEPETQGSQVTRTILMLGQYLHNVDSDRQGVWRVSFRAREWHPSTRARRPPRSGRHGFSGRW